MKTFKIRSMLAILLIIGMVSWESKAQDKKKSTAKTQQKRSTSDSGIDDIDRAFDIFFKKWNGKNKMAIDFTAYDVNDKPLKLSDFRGKVVILDFWYTSCHMCIEGFPAVHELAVKYEPQNVVVVTACMPEKRENFEKFVNNNKEKYPNFLWVQDRSAVKMNEGIAMKQYGLVGAPTQMIIDKNGRVIAGVLFHNDLLAALVEAGVKVDKNDIEKAEAERRVIEERRKKNKEDGV